MASASHSLPDSPSATLRTDCGSLPPMPSGRFSATHALTVASSPRLETRSDDPPSNHPSHCQSSDLSAAPTSRCSDPAVAVAVVSPASATNRLSTHSGSGRTRRPRHFCAIGAASGDPTAPQRPFLPADSSCCAPTMFCLDRDAACGTPTAPHPLHHPIVREPATCLSFSSPDAGCNDLAPFSLTPALLVAILPSPGTSYNLPLRVTPSPPLRFALTRRVAPPPSLSLLIRDSHKVRPLRVPCLRASAPTRSNVVLPLSDIIPIPIPCPRTFWIDVAR